MADGPKGLGYYYTKPKPKVASAAGTGTTPKKPAGPPVRTHTNTVAASQSESTEFAQTRSGQTQRKRVLFCE